MKFVSIATFVPGNNSAPLCRLNWRYKIAFGLRNEG